MAECGVRPEQQRRTSQAGENKALSGAGGPTHRKHSCTSHTSRAAWAEPPPDRLWKSFSRPVGAALLLVFMAAAALSDAAPPRRRTPHAAARFNPRLAGVRRARPRPGGGWGGGGGEGQVPGPAPSWRGGGAGAEPSTAEPSTAGGPRPDPLREVT